MAIRVALALVMVASAAACSSTASSPYSTSRMGPTDAYRPSSYRDNYGFYTSPSAYAPTRSMSSIKPFQPSAPKCPSG